MDRRHIHRVTFDANGGTGTMSAQTVNSGSSAALTVNSFTKSGYVFAGWSTSASGTVEYTDGQTISIAANITLYAIWQEPLANKVSVGDYITYIPSNTSYTPLENCGVDTDYTGTINPSEMQLWQVFKINDDGTVEIISADPGLLGLIGEKAYDNIELLLQDLSSAYINPDYAVSARHLGSDYDADLEILNNNSDIKFNEDTLWLPSKYTEGSKYSSSGKSYYIRCITSAEREVFGRCVYIEDQYGGTNDWGHQATCPVVTLKANVVPLSGSGTSSNPYLISGNIITANQSANGTISPESIAVIKGESASFMATPNTNYYVSKIIVDGNPVLENVSPSAETYNSTVENNHIFTFSNGWEKTNSFMDLWCHSLDDDDSSIQTITLNGVGTLSFDYKVSSEEGYDKLHITVKDDSGTIVAVDNISGEKSGTFSKEISGNTIITATYSKDSGGPGGDDEAFIRNFKFTSLSIPEIYEFTNVNANHTITAEFSRVN